MMITEKKKVQFLQTKYFQHCFAETKEKVMETKTNDKYIK